MSYALDTRNYFDNGDAKKGTFNFSLFNTTFTNNVPTTITLGAAGLTLSAVTTNPLINKVSLQLVKGSAVNTQGQGIISSELRLNRGDLAKVLTWAFEYERVSGTLDLSGSSTSSFEIWIYDVQSATWQQPSGFRSMTQGTLGGFASGEFQTLSTATSVRLAIIYRQTDTNTWTVNFDDFQLVRNKPQRGSFISDWQSFTPTGSWTTNTTYVGRYRRVGKQLECNIRLNLAGAPNSATLNLNLPSGLTIDSADLAGTAFPNVLGYGGASRGGNGTTVFPYYSTTTAMTIGYDTGSGTYAPVTQAAPSTWGSGDEIHITFKVPIVGWSSTQVLSSDTDTRVIASRVTKSGTQSITANTDVKVTSFTVDRDSAGMWDSTNNRFNIPVTGFYRINAQFHVIGGGAGLATIAYRRNGGSSVYFGAAGATATDTRTSGGDTFFCNAGDFIEVYAYTTQTTSNLQTDSYMSMERVSGPSQIAASEVVGFRAGGSVTSCGFGVFTTVVNPTVAINTHGAYNSSTGVFTAPVTGLYRFSGSVHWSNLTTSTAAPYIAAFYKNNVEVTNGNFAQRISNESCAVVTDLIQLNQGDTVDLRAYQADSSPNARALSGNAARNNFSGQRVN